MSLGQFPPPLRIGSSWNQRADGAGIGIGWHPSPVPTPVPTSAPRNPAWLTASLRTPISKGVMPTNKGIHPAGSPDLDGGDVACSFVQATLGALGEPSLGLSPWKTCPACGLLWGRLALPAGNPNLTLEHLKSHVFQALTGTPILSPASEDCTMMNPQCIHGALAQQVISRRGGRFQPKHLGSQQMLVLPSFSFQGR